MEFSNAGLLTELSTRVQSRQIKWSAFFKHYETASESDDVEVFDVSNIPLKAFDDQMLENTLEEEIEISLNSRLKEAVLCQEKSKILHGPNYDKYRLWMNREMKKLLKEGISLEEIKLYVAACLKVTPATVKEIEKKHKSKIGDQLRRRARTNGDVNIAMLDFAIREEYERICKVVCEEKLICYCVKTLIDATKRCRHSRLLLSVIFLSFTRCQFSYFRSVWQKLFVWWGVALLKLNLYVSCRESVTRSFDQRTSALFPTIVREAAGAPFSDWNATSLYIKPNKKDFVFALERELVPFIIILPRILALEVSP